MDEDRNATPRLVLALLFMALAHLAWLLWPPHPGTLSRWPGETFYIPAFLLGAALCWRAGTRLEVGARSARRLFGTGHPALAHLPRPPVSSLKIDRVFVRDLGNVPGAERVAATPWASTWSGRVWRRRPSSAACTPWAASAPKGCCTDARSPLNGPARF